MTKPGRCIPPPPDELSGCLEVVCTHATRPEHVDLLERQVTHTHRRAFAREPDDDHATGGRHELDRRLHELGDTRGLEDDLWPVPARPFADGGGEIDLVRHVQEVGAAAAP